MSKPKSIPRDKAKEEKIKEQKERVIRMLRTALRLLGLTNREIERRLGYTPSYLTRLFSGQIELRFEHIAEIVDAMGMTTEEFFQFAYPVRTDERSDPAIKLNEMLEELRPGKHPEWTPELQHTIATLIVQNMDKIVGSPDLDPEKMGVRLIHPSELKSSSKRSRKSQSRKR